MVNSNNDDDIKNGIETEGAREPDSLDTTPLAGDDLHAVETNNTPDDADAGEPETPASDAATQATAAAAPTTRMGASPLPKKKSGISGKAIAVIVVVVLLAGTMVAAGFLMSSKTGELNSVKFDSKRMELLVSELLPPMQQQQLASNPEQKKTLVKTLKQILAVAQQAEKEGYAAKPDVQSKIAIQSDLALREAYEKKNPGVKVTDEEINAYNQAHPSEFDQLLESEPQFRAQAQGPQLEQMKKEFGQIKVIAEKARAQKLDQDEGVKLKTIIGRSQALFQAYMKDLQSSPDLVKDGDIEAYYNEHKPEFEEVRARHILFGTTPSGPGAQGAQESKGMSKEEARKKAEATLERIKKGEDFATLAKQLSDDSSSKANGGLVAMDESGSDDSKYFGKGAMVPEFEQAAFALKPGEVSGVVESDFGYHIIKVEDKRTASVSQERIKQTISDKLKKEKLEKRIEEITAASNIEVAEDFPINPKPVEPQGMPGIPGMPPGAGQQAPRPQGEGAPPQQ